MYASNFDFEVDRACDDCCTYPKMNLSLSQKWNERNYSNLDTLYDIHAKPYKINDLKYFLSSWAWQDSDGITYTVDSVHADCLSSILSYTPDILTADTRQFSYVLGTIRLAPLSDSLKMTFGLVEDFSCLDENDASTPQNLTKQSPLWNQKTSMLETLRLVIQRDLDTVTYDTVFLTTKLEFCLPYELSFRKGFDEQFAVTVNYSLWFQDVDISDLSSFQTSIKAHLPGSITPTN